MDAEPPAPAQGLPQQVPAVSEDEEVAVAYFLNDVPCPSPKIRGNCKKPNCLHNLGEKEWLDGSRINNIKRELEAENDTFRQEGEPVGLRNLGATCYMNSLLQVVFHNRPVRAAIFAWSLPPDTPPEALTSGDQIMMQLQRVFAFMQASKQRVYEPNILVDALQMSHGTQQDADEFSKLFLQKIEPELAKSGDRTLTQQYSGELEYRTTCRSCRTISDRPETFLELELHVKGHNTMEECLASLFHPEELSGSNMYQCGVCRGKRDATRQIVLNRLPPVLCFHVLRYVYDMKSGNKKKLSHAITFPEFLDLSAYTTNAAEPALYCLDAALMHNGTSANCGHYFAHLRSDSGPWMQLNDEVCSEIEPEQVGSGDPKKKGDAAQPKGRFQSKSVYMLYYRRYDPAAAAAAAAAGPDPSPAAAAAATNGAGGAGAGAGAGKKTKGRKSSRGPDSAATFPPPPPPDTPLPALPPALMAEVHAANTAAELTAAERASVIQATLARESVAARKRVAILEQLAVPAGSPDYVWVPTAWLQAWISIKPTPLPALAVEPLFCSHNRLSLAQMPHCKRISSAAWEALRADVDYTGPMPPHGPASLCRDCVRQKRHNENLDDYIHEMAKAVWAEFAAYQRGTVTLPDTELMWLTRVSFEKFKALNSKTKAASRTLNDDALCKHGNLSLSTSKLQMPLALWAKIEECVQSLGGRIHPLPVATTLPCDLCRLEREEQQGHKRDKKAEAEHQRGLLRRLAQYHMGTYETGLEAGENGPTLLYVLPRAFYDTWLMWSQSPIQKNSIKPTVISTELLMCEHTRCCFILDGVSITRRHPDLVLVTEAEWMTLLTLYELRGPPITFDMETTDPPPCHECIEARRFQYDQAEIYVQLISAERPPSPKAAAAADGDGDDQDFAVQDTAEARELTQDPPTRRSARRVSKGAKKFTVRSTDTLVALKLQIMNEFGGATPNEQMLFYDNRQLCDHSATLQALHVPAEARLQLAISATDEAAREIEFGFKGTALHGDRTPAPAAAATPAAQTSSAPTPMALGSATGLAPAPTPTPIPAAAPAAAAGLGSAGSTGAEPIVLDDTCGSDSSDATIGDAAGEVFLQPAASNYSLPGAQPVEEHRDSGTCAQDTASGAVSVMLAASNGRSPSLLSGPEMGNGAFALVSDTDSDMVVADEADLVVVPSRRVGRAKRAAVDSPLAGTSSGPDETMVVAVTSLNGPKRSRGE